MNYETMSYGYVRYKSETQSETALNATKIRNLLPNTAVTQPIIDSRLPFRRLHFENRNSTVTIQIAVDGQGLGDDSIQRSKRDFFLSPLSAIDILPEEDNLQFTMIAIKNTHATTNTSDNELKWDVANY
jgi:hypothetical protein